MRTCPGKAKRARSINAVAAGRLSLDERLACAAGAFAEAGLPALARITPFSQPPELDAELTRRGWALFDPTLVMATASLPSALPPLRDGIGERLAPPEEFAEVVGRWRGSPIEERRSHAERVRHSPVPYQGWILFDVASERPLACGQVARERRFVGVYDVFTAPEARQQGLAGLLCERMLARSAKEGAEIGYLQVSADNAPAQRVYRRLGFTEAYGYHYREAPSGASPAGLSPSS